MAVLGAVLAAPRAACAHALAVRLAFIGAGAVLAPAMGAVALAGAAVVIGATVLIGGGDATALRAHLAGGALAIVPALAAGAPVAYQIGIALAVRFAFRADIVHAIGPDTAAGAIPVEYTFHAMPVDTGLEGPAVLADAPVAGPALAVEMTIASISHAGVVDAGVGSAIGVISAMGPIVEFITADASETVATYLNHGEKGQ